MSGKDNVIDDTLSRIETISVPEANNYDVLSGEQTNDPKLEVMKNTSILKIEPRPVRGSIKCIVMFQILGQSK